MLWAHPNSSCHLHFSVRMVKPDMHAEKAVSSWEAARICSLMIMSTSDSREASHTVPVHTPAAPKVIAPAKCRPVVMPPAAMTGVSPAMAAT